MNRVLTWCGVALITLTGCMTFEIETATVAEGEGMAADSTSETIHGSFWGFRWGSHVVEKCEGDDCLGLQRIEYHTNAFFAVASLVSLGLYVPQTVEWWCLVEARNDEGTEAFDGSTENELGEFEEDESE